MEEATSMIVRQSRLCLVCGDVACGTNFNLLTCFSCKSFFRRNAFRLEELRCPYLTEQCVITTQNRRHCAKCRLRKCLLLGMKKEWILTSAQRHLIKNRLMTRTMIRHAHHAATTLTSMQGPFSSNAYNEVPQSMIVSNGANLSNNEPTSTTTAVANNSNAFCINQNVNQNDYYNYRPIANPLLPSFDQCIEQNALVSSTNDFFSYHHHNNSSHFQLSNSSDQANNLSTDQSTQTPTWSGCNDWPNNNHQPCDPSLNIVWPLPRVVPVTRDLVTSEQNLLSHMLTACAPLKNQYKRMVHFHDLYRGQKSSAQINPHMTNRLKAMVGLLSPMESLSLNDQSALFSRNLMEMMNIHSFHAYLPDRQAWALANDEFKVTVLVPVELMRPFMSEQCFEQQKRLPSLFRDEWKSDKVIFNLLTVLALFTVKPEQHYDDLNRIQEEYHRYSQLLRRYVHAKYASEADAEQCYHTLMTNLALNAELAQDILNQYSQYRRSIHKPLPS